MAKQKEDRSAPAAPAGGTCSLCRRPWAHTPPAPEPEAEPEHPDMASWAPTKGPLGEWGPVEWARYYRCVVADRTRERDEAVDDMHGWMDMCDSYRRDAETAEAENERLREALVVISGGICASAQDKHLDPPGSYCGGACYVCIARAALGEEGNDGYAWAKDSMRNAYRQGNTKRTKGAT